MERKTKHRNKPDTAGHFPENLKENPFTVPEGYFESFNERLMEKIVQESPSKVTPVYRISRKVLATAAVVIIFLALGSVLLVRYYHRPAPAALPDFTVTLNDLDEGLGMERFDEFTLVSFYLENSEELNYQENGTTMEKLSVDSTISNKDIEQYLIESNQLENLLLNL